MSNPTTAHPGCAEFERASRLSRRSLLQGMAAGTGLLVAGQMFGDAMMEASFGATGGNVLVVLSFRGGIDGLGVVVPYAESNYYASRPTIAVPESQLLAKDNTFGLHPELAPLLGLWNADRMAAVQAVGMKVPNRSHFEAIEIVEDADPGSTARSGWVNRMIGLGGITAPQEAVHLSDVAIPTMLEGPAPVLATDDFGNLEIQGLWGDQWDSRRYTSANTVWGVSNGPIGQAARVAFGVSKNLATPLKAPYTPANGASYPTDGDGKDLGEALRNAAKLIKADLGTSVITIDFGSWDMHADYGTLTSGDMHSMVGGFASAVAAFFTDLGSVGDRVTLTTISEFGRRLEENGSSGVDHGWGNTMLVMGGGVRQKGYYGTWPGLDDADLDDGDLKVTTDYQNVLGEIITKRFPDRSLSTVFPSLGGDYNPLGFMA